MRWWDRNPARLEQEIERLKAKGLTTTFDPETVKGEVIEIAGSYPLAGRQCELRIVFPDLYPYFRPQVYASVDLALAHHQNPFDGSLCLLGRNTDYWHSEFFIADVIAEQLPKLLASEQTASAGGEPEEELQAEPWIEYLAAHAEIRVAWNANIDVPVGTTGMLELTHTSHAPAFRGYVSRLVNDKGGELFTETESPIPEPPVPM